uniref:Remorin C-terminal domain-containing protein n=1 Tax=Aegilops tauschii subsp. strangulata TaxID=200361 RepID=A0A453JMJ2_AEGTS
VSDEAEDEAAGDGIPSPRSRQQGRGGQQVAVQAPRRRPPQEQPPAAPGARRGLLGVPQGPLGFLFPVALQREPRQVCCSLRQWRQLRVPHGGEGGGGRARPLLQAGAVQVERRGEVDRREARRALQPHLLQEGRRRARPQRRRRRLRARRAGVCAAQRRDTKLRTQVSAPAAAQSSSVSMRDVGTEMTPIASQEQSRSGTPAGAATPSLSPLCSVPASPSASERELQIRTRREIAALGLQLGKMSIASWASKEDRIRTSPEKSAGEEDEAKKEEFEARAAAWAESKKCKFASRYQRKEVKIQEWENCQKSKFEAKMRHAEVQADQMKARAKNSLTKRLSTLSHKVEGKQARVEARRNRRAVRLARQVERIRKTGR